MRDTFKINHQLLTLSAYCITILSSCGINEKAFTDDVYEINPTFIPVDNEINDPSSYSHFKRNKAEGDTLKLYYKTTKKGIIIQDEVRYLAPNKATTSQVGFILKENHTIIPLPRI